MARLILDLQQQGASIVCENFSFLLKQQLPSRDIEVYHLSTEHPACLSPALEDLGINAHLVRTITNLLSAYQEVVLHE